MTRQQIRFLRGGEDSSLPTLAVIREDPHLFCINFSIHSVTASDALLALFWPLLIIFQSYIEKKRQKKTKRFYMILISLSRLVLLVRSPLSVCQMEFMYLIHLGEWATVETKALRHILQAGTLFEKSKHTCVHTHITTYTSTHPSSRTCRFSRVL